MNRVYFPGLNTIRLYAAMCVVLGHVIDYASGYTFSLPIFHWLSFVLLSGYEAVSLFFVLSGFLITYILLNELRESGTIDVRHFYVRRARRIQPLYVLLILLTLAIPGIQQPTTAGLIALLALSPHLVSASLGALGHLWSIGVEEWFYFGLPPVLRRWPVPMLAIAVIGARLLLAVAIPELMEGQQPYDGSLLTLLFMLRFECMAIGALGAWMFINRYWLMRWVYRLELPALLLLVLMIILRFPDGFVYNIMSGSVFLIVILNVATNPRRKLNIEHPALAYLGNVTYGVYMYHYIIIAIIAQVFVNLGLSGTLADVLLYATITVCALLVALASYRWFERPILQLRTAERVHAEMTEVRN